MPRPPLLFIHGAANGAWVWEFWRREMKALGWEAAVLDLRGHGMSMPVDFSVVTMDDYLADVASVVPQMTARLGAHPVIAGWSLGGLIALMYAAAHPETPGLVLMSPSPPLEVAGRASPEEIRATPSGPFGPELYGIYPDDLAASRAALPDLTDDEARAVLKHSDGAQESGFARRQRKRGMSIQTSAIRAPSLVIYGDHDAQISPEHSRRTALLLGGESLALPGIGHWGLVYSEDTVKATAPKLDSWLRRALNIED